MQTATCCSALTTRGAWTTKCLPTQPRSYLHYRAKWKVAAASSRYEWFSSILSKGRPSTYILFTCILPLFGSFGPLDSRGFLQLSAATYPYTLTIYYYTDTTLHYILFFFFFLSYAGLAFGLSCGNVVLVDAGQSEPAIKNIGAPP
ncbi:hypothetical protein GGR50DRAFT_651780 [Xylaria sp. CBS 124048]|nr:hypothetical protein GGR50DRAFT_651780 [Xylaria sp. CBS 124048]